MRQSLQQCGQPDGTLVIHDWGCHIGFLLQRMHPGIVRRIVAMDVGLPMYKGQSLTSAPMMIVIGLVYQWWLAAAFLIATVVPLLGPLIGDAMTRCAIYCMGEKRHASAAQQAKISAAMNYPYFYSRASTSIWSF